MPSHSYRILVYIRRTIVIITYQLLTMNIRSCFVEFHLIFLAFLVVTSIVLIAVGGVISGWCFDEGSLHLCESLFYSNEFFSCLFKILPAGIIFCMTCSLIIFCILVGLQFYWRSHGFPNKEYLTAFRLLNILALSIALILIMTILLLWFLPPAASSKMVLIATPLSKDGTLQEKFDFQLISANHPAYPKTVDSHRQSSAQGQYEMNHGPNLYAAAFIITFVTLIVFVVGHRIKVWRYLIVFFYVCPYRFSFTYFLLSYVNGNFECVCKLESQIKWNLKTLSLKCFL